MKTLRFLAICAIALFCGLPLWAGTPTSAYVNYKLMQDDNNRYSCLLSWETIAGDIYITMSTPSDADGSPSLFRGATGMADVNLNNWKVSSSDAKNYFYREYLGGKTNQMILRRRPNVNIPKGTTITCNQTVEWWNGSNSHNKQRSPQWSYSYGTTCGTLSAPTGLTLSDGVISFGSVADATSYKARVYADGNFVYEQDLNSTQATLNFAAYKSARYMVTVQALNATTYSDESDSVQWNFVTTDMSNIRYIKSWADKVVFSNCNDDASGYASRCYMKGETRFGKDNDPDTLVFTLSSYTKGKTALWRGNTGLNQTDLKYNGEALTKYFDKVASPDGKTELRYITKDKTTLTYGGLISYNASNRQSAEWSTNESGSKTDYASNYMTFFMLYGTNFDIPTPPTPGIPQITNIAANNVITFTGIDDATQYNLRVTNSSDDKVYTQTNITSGATIAYYCYETGTYKVYIDAIKESETVSSAAYSWNVTKQVPVISTIDADWKITFTGTQCADSYNLRVLDGETQMYSQVSISSGDVINFTDYHTRTYKVYVDAIKNSEVVSTSAPFDWALVNPDEPLPSEYCSAVLSSNNTNILLTWETNFVGDVVMRMEDGEKTTNAVARGPEGLGNLTWFKINSSSNGQQDASTYFTLEYAGEGSTTAALRRKPGVTLPTGAIIEYHSHPIQWKCDQNTNAAQTITWNYTYGSTCANLSTPKNLSVAQDGTITFSEVAGATTYTARVYDETASDLLYEQDVVSGNQLTYKAYEDGDYKVTIQATNAQGGYSNESQPAVVWTLTGDIGNLPASNVCDQLIHQNNKSESYAYISINTDENGAFMITIAPDNAKFRASYYVGETGLKYNGEPLTNYFTRTFSQDSKTLTYTPKENVDVHYGKKITFNKYGEKAEIEWYIGSSTYNSPNMSFDYIYGTTCPVEITIYENQNNSTTLTNNNGKEVDVTLNRSFEADGANYTLCLPFSMTADQCLAAFGEGYKLFLMGAAYMKTADVMYLPFSEVTAIEAGKPYLFCPKEGDDDIVNPVIEGVTINAAAPATIGNDVAKMTGIYSPYTLLVENNYILGPDNWLYQSDGNQMLGLRCYFTLTPPAAPAGVRARAVFHNTDVVTDLETVDGSQCTMYDGKYVINGQFVIIRNNVRYNGIGQQVK